MKRFLMGALSFVGVSLVVGLVVYFYSYVFAKTVDGPIEGVERVTQVQTLIGNTDKAPDSQVFSFAVAVRDRESQRIYTGSTEDRQWAVAKVGQCAKARFFPYAPWQLDKAGTYFGVRLLQLYDCPTNNSTN